MYLLTYRDPCTYHRYTNDNSHVKQQDELASSATTAITLIMSKLTHGTIFRGEIQISVTHTLVPPHPHTVLCATKTNLLFL